MVDGPRIRTVIASPKLFANGVDHCRPPECHREEARAAHLLELRLSCRRRGGWDRIIENVDEEERHPLRLR